MATSQLVARPSYPVTVQVPDLDEAIHALDLLRGGLCTLDSFVQVFAASHQEYHSGDPDWAGVAVLTECLAEMMARPPLDQLEDALYEASQRAKHALYERTAR